jgi:hypothetical protein
MMGTPGVAGMGPSLGCAARGLSALFWGLPLALLACVKTALGDGWRAFGSWGAPAVRGAGWPGLLLDTLQACLPAGAAVWLLLHGLGLLGRFQRQERVWAAAVDRAKVMGGLVLALVPFAHWWSLRPTEPLFMESMALLVFGGIALMLALNRVLLRLAAMLPDVVLRSDTALFSRVNACLIGLLAALMALEAFAMRRPGTLPAYLEALLMELGESRNWLFVMLALVPLALTMTLLWKAKESIHERVFGDPHG